MPIQIQYGPDLGLLGTYAFQTGRSAYDRRLEDQARTEAYQRQQAEAQAMLQAQLQQNQAALQYQLQAPRLQLEAQQQAMSYQNAQQQLGARLYEGEMGRLMDQQRLGLSAYESQAGRNQQTQQQLIGGALQQQRDMEQAGYAMDQQAASFGQRDFEQAGRQDFERQQQQQAFDQSKAMSEQGSAQARMGEMLRSQYHIIQQGVAQGKYSPFEAATAIEQLEKRAAGLSEENMSEILKNAGRPEQPPLTPERMPSSSKP